MEKHFYSVIMAGGVGSRFWPLSTSRRPKQFLDILDTGKSLITQTYERFASVCPEENILVVTNESYRNLVKEHIPGISDRQILGEPVGRNTAPCVAYAAEKIAKRDPEGVMVVAPSDHIIRNHDVFVDVISRSLHYASANDELITLGIEPTRPDTGYGYINYDLNSQSDGFHKVKSFTEKPELELAEKFVAAGDYLWNAGIFVWNAKAVRKALQNFLPDMAKAFDGIKDALDTDREAEAIQNIYGSCESISVDYGLMERAANVRVFPAPFDWSDVGTWNALYDIRDKDAADNVITGKRVYARNTSSCMVYSVDERFIALNGVKDLIIVDSGEAIMIADKNDEQAVKQLVNDLKAIENGKYV